MATTLEIPNELISRARVAGINCSQIARLAIEEAVSKLEKKEAGENAAKQNAPTADAVKERAV